MDHYLDVSLLPDPEFAPSHLMNALFAKLHRTLVCLNSNNIGISFPSMGKGGSGLGNNIRLHSSVTALQGLMREPWLSGMRDHAEIGECSPVPTSAGHVMVRRVQAKSSPERLRRRQMKRKGWSAEEARAAIPDSVAETLKLPFLTVRSISTGQTFRLFINQHSIDQAQPGTFNTYGLSQIASLPQF